MCYILPGYMDKLTPGFTLLSDLSKLRKMDLKVYKFFERIMDICNEHGVARVVRVINKDTPDIGFNIMSLFHYSENVTILTCGSEQEAETYLKPQNKEDKISGIS